MPIIIAIIILVLGAICIAFDVSILGALLIVLGVLAFMFIVCLLKIAIKSKKGKTVITIIALILIVTLCLFVLVKCIGGTTSNDDWERCLKCGGDGKVKSESGYNITCPRCNGVGYIP